MADIEKIQIGNTEYNVKDVVSGYTTNVGTVTSVNNVLPVNGNVSLTIPTVNDATLTINQGGTLKGTFTANASSNVTVNLDGNQRNIGEIVSSTIPLTDAGLHLLDGSLLVYGSYKAFIDYIADLYDSGDYTAIFDTEANWQTAVSTYGVCGKFVYDSVNNTVRLPKYNSKIYTGGGEAQVKGNGTTLGLTDGTNLAGLQLYNSLTNDVLQLSPDNYGKPVGSAIDSTMYTGKTIGLTTDGSKSGIIADLSTITTSLDGYYYIVIATSTKTDIQVDIDEIATDLNGKVDKSSCYQIYPVIETYVNGTSWYRVYSDGWCEMGGYVSNNTNAITFLKEFANTNYSVSQMPQANSSSSFGARTWYVSNKLTTSVTFTGSSDPAYWQASGYLAEGQY